jgi:hypothetical protein
MFASAIARLTLGDIVVRAEISKPAASITVI